MRTHKPTPKQIREAVLKVLATPSYRENAKKNQAKYSQYHAPTRAADYMEGLLAKK